MQNKRKNKFIIIVLFVIQLTISCSFNERITESTDVSIQYTNDKYILKSFKLPKGIFKGILYPSNENKKIEIWIIKNNKEYFYNVETPNSISEWQYDVTNNWDIKLISNIEKSKYFIAAKTKDISFYLILPKSNNYSFKILKNKLDENIIFFMNISEDKVENGCFGYIII